MQRCPLCAGEIEDAAMKCRHCESDLTGTMTLQPAGLPTTARHDAGIACASQSSTEAAVPVPVFAMPRGRAVTAADLGWNPIAQTLVVGQLALVAAVALCLRWTPLPMAWTTASVQLATIGGLSALWMVLYQTPGRSRRDWVIAESIAALILLVSGSLILGAGQYVVALWHRPLVDSSLAAADAALGVSVPALVAWMRPHSWLTAGARLAYFSLLPQFILALVGTGVVLRDRTRLWEFLFHFHVCALVTLICSGLFPAACAFTYYGVESLLDQTRFINHFSALRAGTLRVLDFSNIEGLISFPSFHVAGALMVTWAFRGYRAWVWPLVVLNAALIAATVLLGAHYAIDLFATVGVFAGSVAVHRRTIR